ncbi:MAG TPA: alpha/beta fold hydrolase [Gemmatimonadales bacterium]|nr:alpha/beta fold hydrolase [Gemmatimonadales bacterium]
MQEHSIPTSRTARYFTLGTPGAGGVREVWFVCHGYGQLAARFLERFRPLESPERCIVAPEGLSRFYLSESPAERRVGASWMTREDRLNEIDDYVRYLDAVYTVVAPPPGQRVTALGFSQGTATACRWAALGTSRIDRLVLWGGEVPPDLDITRLRVPRLILVYGTRDEFFTPKVVAANEARLREHGIRYELLSFDGGHEIHAATLRSLLESAP